MALSAVAMSACPPFGGPLIWQYLFVQWVFPQWPIKILRWPSPIAHFCWVLDLQSIIGDEVKTVTTTQQFSHRGIIKHAMIFPLPAKVEHFNSDELLCKLKPSNSCPIAKPPSKW